ncbi:DEAD/DEAH box helicase [Lederbergia graminis]|uniref:DEAD/DEAH box helicase n=1 Tax=Lederbergia graminis TaxID=735518 RepID=A0ABW0LJJ9_9BACI
MKERKLTPITPSSSLDLSTYLSGRSLLASEIPYPEEKLQKAEHVHVSPGLTKKANSWQCNRCGNSKQRLFGNFPCANCHQEEGCYYCRSCIMMGRVSSCTPLYQWAGPALEIVPASHLVWDGELSEGQQYASDEAVRAVETASELLVWAVCGAGKTEVLFQAIDKALQLGKRICIATPRTDVVLELAPRFKKVFPTISVAALYGGSEDRHLFAPLTISTTHQLFRFKDAFDVMVVDEVDAFPFSYDENLQWAVEKATKQIGTRIFLTATPSEKWQHECTQGKRPHVKIPARFHRHPLPLPTFKWTGNWEKQLRKGRIPAPIAKWVQQRKDSGKQALLFLPNIELMDQVLPLFEKLNPSIAAVHSEDPERKEKVVKMRRNEISLLLTTTILERGVTFPNIDVAVIGAEDDIFTEAALVQIAGRVGRSVDFPTGNITFFHFGRSRAMLRALFHIDLMNKTARKQGLIDE